jgi:disulfide bond formation protein DsbB
MAFDVQGDRGQAYTLGSVALFLSAAAILIALGYQYIGGYVPCPLCQMQRYAYYAAIPMLFVAVALTSGGRGGWAALLFALVALAYLGNTGLGIYHAGAEWKFWAGPATCGGDQVLATSAGSLLKDLEGIKVVRCDEASWRLLGLSFAGWNAVTSLLLMAVCVRAASAASDAVRKA